MEKGETRTNDKRFLLEKGRVLSFADNVSSTREVHSYLTEVSDHSGSQYSSKRAYAETHTKRDRANELRARQPRSQLHFRLAFTTKGTRVNFTFKFKQKCNAKIKGLAIRSPKQYTAFEKRIVLHKADKNNTCLTTVLF